MHGLPGALGVTSTFPFVGRSAELDRLRTLLPRADGERSRVVVLGGEAGSGKSRLVRELAAGAAADGVRVLYGACDSVLRTPYGPLSYSLKVEDTQVVLHIEEMKQLPAGGIAVSWPGEEPPRKHAIQSGFARWVGTDLRVSKLPFTVAFPK